MRFDEAAKILEHMGYHRSQPKRGSSHWTFRKPGTAPITIPKHEPYVKEVTSESSWMFSIRKKADMMKKDIAYYMGLPYREIIETDPHGGFVGPYR